MKKLIWLLLPMLACGMQLKAQTYTFTKTTVKDSLNSCAFIEVTNLDADPELEIVLTTLQEIGGGPVAPEGAMRMYDTDGGVSGTWAESVLIPRTDATPFLNTPQAMDVNEDGNVDILVQQGFLQTNGGSLSWLEGPSFTTRHAVVPAVDIDSSDFYWHETVQADLDGDGKLDLITTSTNAESAEGTADVRVEWFRHTGNGNFEHYIINDSIGGTFIVLYDVNDDGKEDVVISQFFNAPTAPALRWLELVDRPSADNDWQGTWNHHVIDHTTGLGYRMEFYDIDADGDDELVYVNHNNQTNMGVVDANGEPFLSGLYYFEMPTDPTTSSQWAKTTIKEDVPVDAFDFTNPYSQGAMGIFAIGDVTGNNLPDIIVPGDGADNLLGYINTGSGFDEYTVDVGTMYGMAMIEDIDGDGSNEIIATMHNFPEDFAGAFNPPPGHLKIYKAMEVVATTAHTAIKAATLSPNPANKSALLTLETDTAQEFDLELMDALGRVIYVEKLSLAANQVHTTMLDLSAIAAGTYFVKLSNEEGVTTRRLVKR